MHLKHMKHMVTACAFSATSTCCLGKWRLVDAELDAIERLDVAGRAHRRYGPRRWPRQADGGGRGGRREFGLEAANPRVQGKSYGRIDALIVSL
jgi:hypothetical protein